MDGVLPSNTMQGYILRRLLRRAIRHGRILGIEGLFTKQIAEICINQFNEIYPKFGSTKDEILQIIESEEEKFIKTMENGLKELERLISREETITGNNIFQLYESYGLPKEVTEEILKEKNIPVTNPEGFEDAKKGHQQKSRTASSGIFKGGLADTSEMSTKYHTASHLLLASLRKVLGDHVFQKEVILHQKD